MKTQCQPDENGVCTQCYTSVPPGMHLTCPAKKPEIARIERGVTKYRSVAWVKSVFSQRSSCSYLGPYTGEMLKASCGNNSRTLPEHRCYHPKRLVWLTRKLLFVHGRCTPTGTCTDAIAGVQPCLRCPLYKPQGLLTTSPKNILKIL